MGGVRISPSATVKLSGAGAGQVGLTPPSGTRWDLTLASVSTTSVTNQAKAFLYLGNSNGPLQLIDSTFLGNAASSGKVSGAPFYHGQYVWAVWSGADASAQATLQLFGQQTTRYRAAP
jgi:hypothetical protein